MFRPTSTVYDLSYFFFSTASAEALKNHHYYLNIYYQELCDQIKKFGSDPEFLYPKSAFDSEWKRYCKYGFAFSFVIFKFVLADKEEAPKLENYDFDGASDDTEDIQLFATFSNEDEYVRRLRILAGFMMDNDYI